MIRTPRSSVALMQHGVEYCTAVSLWGAHEFSQKPRRPCFAECYGLSVRVTANRDKRL